MPRSVAKRPCQLWQKVNWSVLLFYGGMTLALTYPVFWQLGTSVAGFDGRDSFQHIWYQWWMKETLLQLGVWPSRVIHLYYPLGANHPVLALHPYVPLVSLPLTLLFGPLVSYNLAFLLSFILSGLTGYLLCRYVCGHTGAAIIGGLIFAFYPNRVGHAAAGHLLLTTNYFLPLYALSLMVLLRRPSPKRAAWYGIVTAMLALAQPTHVGYGIIPIFLFFVGGHLVTTIRCAPTRRSGTSLTKPFFWLVAANVLALLIVLPFAWPALSQSGQGELAYLTPKDLTAHSTDLLAFLLPSPYNPVLASQGLIPPFSTAIIDSFRDLEEQLAYPGLVALILLILAAWKRWRDSGVWLGLTLFCGLLSLGPLLKVGGEIQSLSLPYTWLTQIPFFTWSRTPGRLNETVMLGVAVLASIGAAWLLAKVRTIKLLPGLAYSLSLLGLGALVLIEYIVIFPFPTEIRSISDYYEQLTDEDISGGILELPITGSRRASNYAMYYQTVHEHPLAGGYLERDPSGTVELKEFLNQLLSPIADQTVMIVPDDRERQAVLADINIERVIAHPSLMTDRAARSTKDYLPILLGPTIYEDEDTLVYPVQPNDSELPAWQVLPDQDNWEIVRDGTALRLKKVGHLFIYAAQPEVVNLETEIDGPPLTTELTIRFNDSLTDRYLVESTTSYIYGPIPLQKGLNYFWLATTPPQDLDFSKISVQPAGNQTMDQGVKNQ